MRCEVCDLRRDVAFKFWLMDRMKSFKPSVPELKKWAPEKKRDERDGKRQGGLQIR